MRMPKKKNFGAFGARFGLKCGPHLLNTLDLPGGGGVGEWGGRGSRSESGRPPWCRSPCRATSPAHAPAPSLFTHSLIRSLTHALTRSRTHALTHARTHASTHSLVCATCAAASYGGPHQHRVELGAGLLAMPALFPHGAHRSRSSNGSMHGNADAGVCPKPSSLSQQ